MIPKVCIVGAGPAGFYTAQHILKLVHSAKVDIYEKLPVPFGLVRYGVAPDHPEVKNVEHTFTKTAQHPNVQFLGNVTLGRDVTLKALRDSYNAVVLTYGAEENKRLNIPGEDLNNVLPARKIVGWYNGIPEDTYLKIDLSGPSVAIFGQGNVGIDVARILLTPIDFLMKTDITNHSLEVLKSSKVQKVHLIGRRGPLQAAFTIKELREMLKLPKCKTCWTLEDFNGIAEVLSVLTRPRKRITELMLKSAHETISNEGEKVFKPTFFKFPLELIGSTRVTRAILGCNVLEGKDLLNKRAILTDRREEIDCDLAVTSIGYKSVSVDPDIPFDHERGLARNDRGRIDKGLYTSGWLATGPRGVILTTMSDAFATAETICKDLIQDTESKAGFESIGKELKSQGVQVVTWKGWEKIDEYEQQQGQKYGKPREKIVDVQKMLEIAA